MANLSTSPQVLPKLNVIGSSAGDRVADEFPVRHAIQKFVHHIGDRRPHLLEQLPLALLRRDSTSLWSVTLRLCPPVVPEGRINQSRAEHG